MKKKTIRVGMRVRSLYHPEREFTLDRSLQPDRIFRCRKDNWRDKRAEEMKRRNTPPEIPKTRLRSEIPVDTEARTD
jgi:hypothetical protein